MFGTSSLSVPPCVAVRRRAYPQINKTRGKTR
nr:MAG TPA: hypothetical protein [Bacteriophage sp.]